MPEILSRAAVALAAFLITVTVTPLAQRLGERWGMVAVPGGRRQHAHPISRLGGLSLFAGFFSVALGLLLFAPLKGEHLQPILGVLAGTAFVFLGGLADDKFELKSGPQFAIQFGAAVIAILFTVWIQEVTFPAQPRSTIFSWYITYPLTVVWIMGMMNTVNFLDGLDGLAAGVGAIAAVLFAIHSINLQQKEIALYSLALAGACLGLLVFNFQPARIFLGSAGAMTLGYALATLSILAPARVMTALMVMAIPIADTAFQIIARWRRGLSPFQGDRGHLHFRLLDLGVTQWKIVVVYWIFCAMFGGLVVYMPSIYKPFVLGALGLVVILGLLWLNRKQKKS